MPKNQARKGRVHAGKKSRCLEENEEAIGRLLAHAKAKLRESDQKDQPYVPDPLLAIVRILRVEANEWFAASIHGREMRLKGLDMGITHIVSQLCKRCRQASACSKTWPIVIVSLPEPTASKQTGEILAVLSVYDDPKEVQTLLSQFKSVGHTLCGSDRDDAEGDDGFVFGSDSEEEEVDIDAI